MKIGLQLYTVREDLERDFKGTLGKVKELGYDGVELACMYGGMAPEELAVFMKGLHLEVSGMHCSLDAVGNPDAEEYVMADALGCRYVTASLPADAMNGVDAAVTRLERAGRTARAHGRVFGYHNHAHELQKYGDERILDAFFTRTDPVEVQSELDIYWVQKGDADPVIYMNKYADRLPLVHIKDMEAGTGDFAPVGTGILDMAAVVDAAVHSGTQWLIVEQDVCKQPALECVSVSISNVRRLLG